ncbi:MAG: glycosyltransferase [Sedimenticola sp.]
MVYDEILISVVMPVYNGQKYLKEALESVLNQTHKNFELIVIDDGSTDKSLEILKSYKDSRVSIVSRENRGLIFSLNEGIRLAKGKYIARMDADDISLPTRFHEQIALMENESLDICGGHYFIINGGGKYTDAVIVPTTEDNILLNISYTVPFAHGSVMIRKEILDVITYDVNENSAVEDYALWVNLIKAGCAFGNVSEFIFSYRDTGDSFSKSKYKLMRYQGNIISKSFLREFRSRIKQSIDSVLLIELSVYEQYYLVWASCALRYKMIDVYRKVPLNVFIVGFLKVFRKLIH